MGAAALALAAAGPAHPQGRALVVTEAGAGAMAILAHRAFWGPELSVARRAGAGGEGRFALSAAGGDYDGEVGIRLQATAQLLLRPSDRTGLGPYAGLGLAFVGAEAIPGAGYLTGVLGVEAAPGRAAGWYAELGLGGGVRLAAGRRWRRFPPWW
jgi:hypothetical protein